MFGASPAIAGSGINGLPVTKQPAPAPSQHRRLLTKLQGDDARTQPELELQQAVSEAAGIPAAAGWMFSVVKTATHVALGQDGGMQQMLGGFRRLWAALHVRSSAAAAAAAALHEEAQMTRIQACTTGRR